MLSIDLAGNIITPGRLVKRLGGDFDEFNGIPNGFDIPTDGDYSGVTISNTGGPHFAKYLTRTAAGKCVIHGPEFSVTSEMMAFRLQAKVVGGGSSATSNNTRRHFRYGFSDEAGQNGAYLEYLSPDGIESGSFITTLKSGIASRQKINFQTNNPAERYALNLWVSRNPITGSWTVTLGEGEQIRTVMDIPTQSISMANIRPFIEWEWTATTGVFLVSIAQFTTDIYWRF